MVNGRICLPNAADPVNVLNAESIVNTGAHNSVFEGLTCKRTGIFASAAWFLASREAMNYLQAALIYRNQSRHSCEADGLTSQQAGYSKGCEDRYQSCSSETSAETVQARPGVHGQ